MITVVAAVVVLYVLLKSGWMVRIFVAVCFAVTAASLLFPLASTGTDPWTVLSTTGVGDRYFFSAEVAWLVCVAWALSRIRPRAVRWAAAGAVTALFLTGVASYPQYPAARGLPPGGVRRAAPCRPPGAVVRVPLNPNPSWAMALRRGG